MKYTWVRISHVCEHMAHLKEELSISLGMLSSQAFRSFLLLLPQ